MHYINYGHKEGRQTTGITTVCNPTTIYNGKDYSLVYDYYYYVKAVPKINLTVPQRSVKKISEKAELLSEEPEQEEEMLTDEERYALGEELDEETDGDNEDVF